MTPKSFFYIIRKTRAIMNVWTLFLSNHNSFIFLSRVWWLWESWVRRDSGSIGLHWNFSGAVAFICIFIIIFLFCGLWKNGRLLVGNLENMLFILKSCISVVTNLSLSVSTCWDVIIQMFIWWRCVVFCWLRQSDLYFRFVQTVCFQIESMVWSEFWCRA